MRTIRVSVSNVLIAQCPNRTDTVISLITSISGTYRKFSFDRLRTEERSGFHILRNINTREIKRGGGQINMKNGVFSYRSTFNPIWSMNKEGNHHSLIIAKLLTPCMADSMISNEKDYCIFKFTLLF